MRNSSAIFQTSIRHFSTMQIWNTQKYKIRYDLLFCTICTTSLKRLCIQMRRIIFQFRADSIEMFRGLQFFLKISSALEDLVQIWIWRIDAIVDIGFLNFFLKTRHSFRDNEHVDLSKAYFTIRALEIQIFTVRMSKLLTTNVISVSQSNFRTEKRNYCDIFYGKGRLLWYACKVI